MKPWCAFPEPSTAEGWAVGEGPDGWWCGGLLRSQALAVAEQHNLDRPVIADVEAMLTRVLTASLRELLRGLIPRRLRRPIHNGG